MPEMMLKRTWTHASVVGVENGFVVYLDGASLSTPEQRVVQVPTPKLAEALQHEWQHAPKKFVPMQHMPLSVLVITALDHIAPHPHTIAHPLRRWLETDLLHHPSPSPEALKIRQEKLWTPEVEWFERATGRPATTPLPHDFFHSLCPFTLAALQQLTEATGSFILAYGALKGRYADAAQILEISETEVLFQAQHWGMDPDTEQKLSARQAQIGHGLDLLTLLHSENDPC
ncbi:MAG: hypothetical protein EBZ69_03140 [Alphaproteobacteria bacterium]|nr:hypothetical protein [Alphaproteobacteria bacterium]NDC55797.1 hypothetical protein [Alphaproteobacteria bacterium]